MNYKQGWGVFMILFFISLVILFAVSFALGYAVMKDIILK